jgi:acetyl-CoA carboxylase biotin carboxylase subunit
MIRALDEAVIEGIRTNRELHIRILQDEDFRGNNYSTNFLAEKMQ